MAHPLKFRGYSEELRTNFDVIVYEARAGEYSARIEYDVPEFRGTLYRDGEECFSYEHENPRRVARALKQEYDFRIPHRRDYCMGYWGEGSMYHFGGDR